MKSIDDNLVKGINNAYIQNLNLKSSDRDFAEDFIEYLFTVNVAQQMLKWRHGLSNRRFSVHLEYDATEFYERAFRMFRLNPHVIRKKHKPKRKGRIDIAIMEHKVNMMRLGPCSFAGIELKAINPTWNTVADDFVRLLGAITQSDPVDENSIALGYVAFVKRFESSLRGFEDSDYVRKRTRFEQALGKRILSQYKPTDIQVSSIIWQIDKTTSRKFASFFPPDDIDPTEVLENSGAAIGVIIKLERRQNS